MTNEQRTELKGFFKTSNGKAVLDAMASILTKHTDIRIAKNRENAESIPLAIDIFLDWIDEIFGEIERLDVENAMEHQRSLSMREHIYRVHGEREDIGY